MKGLEIDWLAVRHRPEVGDHLRECSFCLNSETRYTVENPHYTPFMIP